MNNDYEDEYEYEDDKKPRGGCLNRIIFFFAFVLCIAGTYIGCLGYDLYQQAAAVLPVEKMGEKIRSDENFTPIEEVPVTYLDAVVAVEDRSFYSHRGISFKAIARAIITNIESGSLSQGGSTITQQLAKNVWFSHEKSFVRKAAEVFAVIDIEKTFTKEEILELYINTIYFGDDCYSIGEASMHYFGISPHELDDYQCTMLAGIPNAPSVYSPNVNPELAEQRRIQVTEALYDAGYISEEQYDALCEPQATDY